MNKDKVYLKGYVIGHAADTLGYNGLMVQLENLDVVEIDKNLVHRDINKPQKAQVPQFVADWYEANKDDFETKLFRAIDLIPSDYEEGDLSEFEEWLVDEHTAPFQTLVNMHQFGYEVEKEKRYYVRFKNMESNDFNYLNFIKFQHAWVLSSIKLDKKFRTEHTKKQLEEAGFGWVFDCEGIEIEEVEE
jgi:gp178|uniref:Phage protein n=1 Tax=Siphoviridae sp. ctM4S20 TaxID=2825458 RepID=A0A8S5P8J7_9CAUD|nr:MAG TPA: Protein of unknown function (DUF1642) [Siphoviridae sp. ctM4S20]